MILLEEVRKIRDVSKDQLIEALYIIRAHRTLRGIIPAVKRFFALLDEYPEFYSLDMVKRHPERLNVLKAIIHVSCSDKNLQETTDDPRYRSTPLRPVTGDSAICDILLIDCEKGASAKQVEQYEHMVAWFVWQAMHFNALSLSIDNYEAYLIDGARRLSVRHHGPRLYNAFLYIRRYADSVSAGGLNSLYDLDLQLCPEYSARLTVLSRLNYVTSRMSLDLYARRNFGLDSDQIKAKRLQLKDFPQPLTLFLLTIWLPRLEETDTHLKRGGNGGRKSFRFIPNVSRSRFITTVTDYVDGGGVHDGTVIDYYPKTEPASDEIIDSDIDDEDPDDREAVEPNVSLFLADQKDIVRGYYASKSVQYSIEYANARLPWARNILSQDAIKYIASLVKYGEVESLALRRARLAIGISLISGRSLDEAATTVFKNNESLAEYEYPILIRMDTFALVVVAGTPSIKAGPADRNLCHPRSLSIELPLPIAWHPLINSLYDEKKLKKSVVIDRARKLLKQIDPVYGVKEGGIRYALGREIGFQAKGDLGALKIITDSSDINLNNIIHYASSDKLEIERVWRDAAGVLVGALPQGPGSAGRFRVGAADAFDEFALKNYFTSVKQRLVDALANNEPIKAFNLATLYLSYWLGLACAGRKSKKPLPKLVLSGDWALIADKSRVDGSTDRLLPLTKNLIAQLESYIGMASMIAVSWPELDPITRTEQGLEIRLQYLDKSGKVVPYRPKYQEQGSNLEPLPGNWARKFVRAESKSLSGRLRDTGLGHWARGRHSWRQTGTLAAQEFKRQWLDLELELEQSVGFSVVPLVDEGATQRSVPKLPAVARKRDTEDQSEGKPKQTTGYDRERIKTLLYETNNQIYGNLFNTGDEAPPDPSLALKLAQSVLDDLERPDNQTQADLAFAVCDYIRNETKIPIYSVCPRRQFSQDWVVDAAALQTLSYIEEQVLPKFNDDLRCLPNAVMDTQKGRDIELGRLVMIAIWRMGLNRWPLVDALLKALSRGAKILAAGELRYLVIKVRCEKTNELMGRTVLLDDFTYSYLLIERARLGKILKEVTNKYRERRNGKAQKCVNSYLRSINACKCPLKIAAMAQAAVQSLMLGSSSMVAAYSAGQFYTQDIDDAELRRLSGLTIHRQGIREEDSGHDVGDKEYRDDGDSIPEDINLPGHHELSKLLSHDGVDIPAWRASIYKQNLVARQEKLLKNYAVWLLDRQLDENKEKLNTGQRTQTDWKTFTTREKNNYLTRVQIIGHALYGLAVASQSWTRIDEEIMETLQELSAEFFPSRGHQSAWFKFHTFLLDSAADHAGFEIGRLGRISKHMVSAKILSRNEQEAVAQLLPSARSGIGNPDFRLSASRLWDLVSTYGVRRSEAEKVRPKDYQGDLIRIQPYGEHNLKTAWSERVLPFAYAPKHVQEWIKRTQVGLQNTLIDPDDVTQARGDNFFDAMNRLIKEATQDKDLALHHLRHTVASSLALSMLADSVDLAGIFNDLPWVEPLLIEKARLDVLLGYEGNGGQGMQVVSAILGHSHTTTTVRHYVHILCIALWAALRSIDRLDIGRSFERRVASRAQVQRWRKGARERAKALNLMEDTRAGREMINRDVRDSVTAYVDEGFHFDETPIGASTLTIPVAMPTQGNKAKLTFDRLEAIDRSLRDGESIAESLDVSTATKGLGLLAEVVGGKKGAQSKRHPLKKNDKGQYLPKRLAAASSTKAAVMLCDWLEQLRDNRPKDFDWLIEKWVHDSSKDRGWVRVAGKSELNRVSQLRSSNKINLACEEKAPTKSRATKRTNVTVRMRIRCLDNQGNAITRDTEAVRWVMSYVCALYYFCRPKPLLLDNTDCIDG